MTHLVKELLAERASEEFVGRADELGALLSMLDGGPRITLLHGIPGVGKSALLAMFRRRARARGAAVVSLDCRAMEPTERGFLHELGVKAYDRGSPRTRASSEHRQ